LIDTYRHYLKLVNDPVAAAILAVGVRLTGTQPANALSPKQAAAQLGVSVDMIYDLCQRGKLRSMKIGRAVRIRAADLEDYRTDVAA
jgi:excisionase family DNA binding protein